MNVSDVYIYIYMCMYVYMTETVRLTRGLLQLFQEPEWVVENGAAKAE
jgi:hypothetical protein